MSAFAVAPLLRNPLIHRLAKTPSKRTQSPHQIAVKPEQFVSVFYDEQIGKRLGAQSENIFQGCSLFASSQGLTRQGVSGRR